LTPSINIIEEGMLKTSTRARGPHYSPDAAHKIVMARTFDETKIYKGGLVSHSVPGNASNTVDGPASIAELTRALKNDPQLIYEWVYNNIDWDPGWGIRTGALGCLLTGRGNAFDQSALLVTMLRTAGFTANYVLGQIQLNAAAAGAWFGTDPTFSDESYAFYSEIPVQYVLNPVTDDFDIQMGHVWVQCVISGTTYVFDPSYKTYARKTGVSNLGAIMEYDSAGFVSSAEVGSTYDPGGEFISNVNNTNIDVYMTAMASNLATWLKANNPTAGIDDLLGGQTIVPVTLPVLNISLPYEVSGDSTTIWTGDIPINYKVTFRFFWTDANIDQTFTSDQLTGARLTIRWNDITPTLYLNGAVVQVGSAVDFTETFPNFTVTHNAFTTFSEDETNFLILQTGAMGLVGTAFSGHGRGMLNYHQTQLDIATASGAALDSESVLGEAFATLWATYVAEFDSIYDLTGRINHFKLTLYHAASMIEYDSNSALNLDIASYLGTPITLDSDGPDPDTDRGAQGPLMLGSAIERAIFQQITATIPSANTTSAFQANNAAGNKIYQATSANYTSDILPILTAGGYPTDTLTDLENNYINAGYMCEVTERGDTPYGSFTTNGWLYWTPTENNGCGAVVGGSGGGRGSIPQTPKQINDNAKKNQRNPISLLPPKTVSKEPIDMFTGDYTLTWDDISVGSRPFPYGLGFNRSYNSRNRMEDGVLGLGWTHNYNLSLAVNTDAFLALGEQCALHAVSTIATLYAMQDLSSTTDISQLPLDKHVITALVSCWWVDQVTQNTVVLTMPNGAKSYVRLPDGSYLTCLNDASKLSLAAGIYTIASPQGEKMVFNAAGQLSQWTFASGASVSLSYTSGLLALISTLGRNLSLTYSGTRIATVTDGPRTLHYGYDANGNLTSFTDANAKVFTYQYDQPGRMTKFFKPQNPTIPVTTNVYDTLSRVQTQTDAFGNLWTYYFAGSRSEEKEPLGNSRIRYFNNNGSQISYIDALGNRTNYVLDNRDRVTQLTMPEGNKIQWTYDLNNNVLTKVLSPKPGSALSPITYSYTYDTVWSKLKTATEGLGYTTTYSYDAATGALLTIQSPNLSGVTPTIHNTYNTRGQILTSTDETGIVTSFTYSATNETLSSITYDSGASPHLNITIGFAYDAVGNLTGVTDANGNQKTATYDNERRVQQVVAPSPLSYVSNYFYDANGNLTSTQSQVDATSALQTYTMTYSYTDKMLTLTDPASSVVSYQYDALDRVWKTTDADSLVTTTTYDTVGRVMTVVDPTGTHSQTTTYTVNGKSYQFKDASNHVTTFAYDGFDRPLKTTYPDGSYEQINSYDANGNITSLRSRSGLNTTATFDTHNRIATKSPSGQAVVTYSYDLAGRLTGMNTPVVANNPASGSFQFTLDSAGRLVAEVAPDGKTASYVLDKNGNRTKITYPDGYYVTRAHDALNRLSSINLNGASSAAASFTYDKLSRRTQLSFNNSVVTNYTDALNDDLSTLSHTFSGSSLTYTYGFNHSHQITSTQVSDSTYMWHPSAASSVSYGAANSLDQYPTVGGAAYTYDANGNLSGTGTWTYTYDVENHLLSASKTGVSASYLYDPMHRQTKKTVGSTSTRYFYSGQQRLSDYDGTSGSLLNRYVYGTGLDEPLITVSSAGVLAYMHSDSSGSIIATSNASGVVTNKNAYSPFGESSAVNGTTFGFTGQRYDAETGLYYYKNRYYSPTLGRFLQPDPIGMGDGTNLYKYVNNDPLNQVDSLGLSSEQDKEWGNNHKGYDGEGSDWGNNHWGWGWDHNGWAPDDADPNRDPWLGTRLKQDANYIWQLGADIEYKKGQIEENTYDYYEGRIGGYSFAGQGNLYKNVGEVLHNRNGLLPVNPLWFKSQVQKGARWDFKDIKNYPVNDKAISEPYGNFHYGAMAYAAGYPLGFALRAAGAAQIADNDKLNLKRFGVTDRTTYLAIGFIAAGFYDDNADDPRDQARIIAGYNFVKNL
jgi:RHS repeat-associated protein